MKMRTRLLILLVGLASLWCSVGPAKAQWTHTLSSASGYPIKNPSGGSGDAYTWIQFPGPASANSNESCTASGLSGTTASPDYEMQTKVVYTWEGMGPPSLLTFTFSAQASASFSNNNSSSYGHASAGASTDAASVQAGVSVSSGSNTDSPPSQTVTFPSAFTQTFYLNANSSAYGYVYGANNTGGDSSFTSGSSSAMSYGT